MPNKIKLEAELTDITGSLMLRAAWFTLGGKDQDEHIEVCQIPQAGCVYVDDRKRKKQYSISLPDIIYAYLASLSEK